MKRFNYKITALFVLAALLVAQLFSIDKSAPAVDPTEDLYSDESVPQDVRTLLRKACKDCHSYETSYPWYASIQPLGWWLNGHVKHGRENLNFSKWNSYDQKKKEHKTEECIEVLEQRRMPFKSYTWLHEEARLSEDEYNRLISYFESVR